HTVELVGRLSPSTSLGCFAIFAKKPVVCRSQNGLQSWSREVFGYVSSREADNHKSNVGRNSHGLRFGDRLARDRAQHGHFTRNHSVASKTRGLDAGDSIREGTGKARGCAARSHSH